VGILHLQTFPSRFRRVTKLFATAFALTESMEERSRSLRKGE
jgi:hypothetical protein